MLALSGNTITLDVNLFTSLTYSLTSSYLEASGNFDFWFGFTYSGSSFQGYLWNLILASGSLNKNNYYGSTGALNCLVYSPCDSPCSPALVENGVAGCVSLKISPLVNSNGVTCNCGSVGCIGSVCLSCSCTYLSCEVIGAISDFGVRLEAQVLVILALVPLAVLMEILVQL